MEQRRQTDLLKRRKKQRKPLPWQTKNLWFLSSSSETEPLRLYLRHPPRLTSGELAACGDWEWGGERAVDSVITRYRKIGMGKSSYTLERAVHSAHHTLHFLDHLCKTPQVCEYAPPPPHWPLLLSLCPPSHLQKDSLARQSSPLIIDDETERRRCVQLVDSRPETRIWDRSLWTVRIFASFLVSASKDGVLSSSLRLTQSVWLGPCLPSLRCKDSKLDSPPSCFGPDWYKNNTTNKVCLLAHC